MSEMMNAIVKTGSGFGAEFKRVNKPTCKADEVLIKVKAAAVCGTDLHVYDWNSWAA